MLEFPRLNAVRKVKHAIMMAMAILALLNLYHVVVVSMGNLQKLEHWSRQPATIIGLARGPDVEVEVSTTFADTLPGKAMPEICLSHRPDTTCLLVPGNPYAWYSLFDEVELIQEPERPEVLEVLSMTGLWAPVLENLILILVLVVVWRWMLDSGWGEDRTWSNGRWLPSESAPQRIGFGSLRDEPIREEGSHRKAVIFWLILFFLVAGILLPGLLIESAVNSLEAVIIMAVVVAVLMSILYSAVRSFTRSIYQDETGLIDSDFFGVRRVPWATVGGIELVNLNKDAQARYRGRFGAGQQPRALNVYVVSGKQGEPILRLSEQMVPAAGFEALLTRLGWGSERGGSSLSEAESARMQAEWMDMVGRMDGKPKSLLHRQNRGLLIALIVMTLPFLAGTAYFAYQSLWFIYGAERSDGKIVEIKNDGLPSLVVEYKTAGAEVLQIESDGSESYGAYHVGDIVPVYYEADKPENARLAFFLELWLGTILMGGLTAIVVILALLIARAVTTPMPGV